MTFPSTSIVPLSGSNNPKIISINVLFPLPVEPKTATFSPLLIVSEASLRIIFVSDLNEKLMLIINKNREIANRLNLRGTPAFVIGNKIYPGALSEKDLEKAIALERKR